MINKIIPLVLFLQLLTATNAQAMHISEGLLPLEWAFLWFVVAVPFMFFGIIRLRSRATGDLAFKPLVGLLTAVVFIISCMPIPVPTAARALNRERGVTIVMATHSVDNVPLFLDRLVIMSSGHIVRTGPPAVYYPGGNVSSGSPAPSDS